MMERCVICENGTAYEVVRDRTVTVSGHKVEVKQDRFMACSHCTAEYFTGEQAQVHSAKLRVSAPEENELAVRYTGDSLRTMSLALNYHVVSFATHSGKSIPGNCDLCLANFDSYRCKVEVAVPAGNTFPFNLCRNCVTVRMYNSSEESPPVTRDTSQEKQIEKLTAQVADQTAEIERLQARYSAHVQERSKAVIGYIGRIKELKKMLFALKTKSTNNYSRCDACGLTAAWNERHCAYYSDHLHRKFGPDDDVRIYMKTEWKCEWLPETDAQRDTRVRT